MQSMLISSEMLRNVKHISYEWMNLCALEMVLIHDYNLHLFVMNFGISKFTKYDIRSHKSNTNPKKKAKIARNITQMIEKSLKCCSKPEISLEIGVFAVSTRKTVNSCCCCCFLSHNLLYIYVFHVNCKRANIVETNMINEKMYTWK